MRVVCEHCGLPFSIVRTAPRRPVYCCSGCALAARVSPDGTGQRPVNAALVTALGVAFAFFNQALFWLLSLLLARSAEGGVNAERFVLASLGVGVVVWLALRFFQFKAGAQSWRDWTVSLAAAALIALGLSGREPLWALTGNVLFAAWAMRGLARKRKA